MPVNNRVYAYLSWPNGIIFKGELCSPTLITAKEVNIIMLIQNVSDKDYLFSKDNLYKSSINPLRHKSGISSHIQFVLCKRCFWSASFLYRNIITQCPVCGCSNTDSIPVCFD